MTNDVTISNAVRYIGVDDNDSDLFEGQYIIPNGISYNSYVIIDDKIAVFDTADACKQTEWQANLDAALNGRTPDYLIISHMEPDHSAVIKTMLDKYPSLTGICSDKAVALVKRFFGDELTSRLQVVNEGETLSLGAHTLQFFMAPMVHWPEVMVTYEQS